MDRHERDISRIVDRLTKRVDRIENRGEEAAETAIFEEFTAEVNFSDDAEVLVDDDLEDEIALSAVATVLVDDDIDDEIGLTAPAEVLVDDDIVDEQALGDEVRLQTDPVTPWRWNESESNWGSIVWPDPEAEE